MQALERSREYLLWYEFHNERWIAIPIVRNGSVVELASYPTSVEVVFDES
jgi:hypothetical protein